MQGQGDRVTTKARAADLRYVPAQNVRFAAGELAGFRVCTEDAHPVGTVEGVLISPSARRLLYLVVESPGLFLHRRYLLPLEAGAVLQEPKVLRIPGRKDELELETFTPRSVPAFSDDDLLSAVFSQDAA
jgi:hypothetical protein